MDDSFNRIAVDIPFYIEPDEFICDRIFPVTEVEGEIELMFASCYLTNNYELFLLQLNITENEAVSLIKIPYVK